MYMHTFNISTDMFTQAIYYSIHGPYKTHACPHMHTESQRYTYRAIHKSIYVPVFSLGDSERVVILPSGDNEPVK